MKKNILAILIFLGSFFSAGAFLHGLERDKWIEHFEKSSRDTDYCARHLPDSDTRDSKARLLRLIPSLNIACSKRGCHHQAIWQHYLNPKFRKYFSHLKQQLEYCDQHKSCRCYWPEESSKAGEISDLAFTLFKDLISTTKMSTVGGKKKYKEFLETPMSGECTGCLTIPFIAQQFRFSHYYLVCQDILHYSKSEFTLEECGQIQDKLDNIWSTLYPKFFDLYEQCLSKHPNEEIEQELQFMKLLVGDISGLSTRSAIDKKTPTASYPKNTSFLFRKSPHTAESTPFFLQSLFFLGRGILLNDLLLYDDAISILTEAIKLNPHNQDAYIERAAAYFETNQLGLALKDYERFNKLTVTPPLQTKSIRFYPKHSIKFSKGLLVGVLSGSGVAGKEFIPSTLSTCRGLLKGLWAFACSPSEITQELVTSAYALGEYISSHSSRECLEAVVPELRKLCLKWDGLNDYKRGKKIGYLIGKYGVDIFIPVAAIKVCSKFRALKRANTLCTLENCVASDVKQAKILEESTKIATQRTAVLEQASSAKILIKSSNVQPHVMQKKHCWDKLIKLSGDQEKDFKKVIALLEEYKIINKNYLLDRPLPFPEHAPKILRSDYKKVIKGHEVKAVFETNIETGQMYLNDAWVAK